MAKRVTLTKPPLTLYVHLPWCVRKCPYCDFNSHTQPQQTPYEGYTDALLRDAEMEASALAGRRIQGIYIGGGTPSLFPPATVSRLLAGIAARLPLSEDCEITMEANPGTVELERFRAFREAGINRLSIGVQSFHDHHLRALGRVHGAAEARQAADAASAAGFERFNLDLMFALPGQTVAEAEADITEALNLGARHISHYQLTLEPGTAFHARPPQLPDEDSAAAMQQACSRRLSEAGLRRYEVSAWAQPGQECRHNLNYWQFGDYLAIGAGAHGKVTEADTGCIERYSKWRMPQQFMARAGTPEALADRYPVAEAERPLEFVMNALRLPDGVPADYLTTRTGVPHSAFERPLRAAEAEGLIETANGRLRPTERGLMFLNNTLGHFLPAD